MQAKPSATHFRLLPASFAASRTFRIFNAICGILTLTIGVVLIIGASAALIADMNKEIVGSRPSAENKISGPNILFIILICLGVLIMFFGCLSLSCSINKSYYRIVVASHPPPPYTHIPAHDLLAHPHDLKRQSSDPYAESWQETGKPQKYESQGLFFEKV